jgi:WD40 repeat protein
VKTVATFADVVSWKGHSRLVRCLAFTEDDKYVVSGSADKSLRVWEASSGKEVLRFPHPDVVTALLLTPDNRYAISACADGLIRMWRLP